MNLVGNWQTPSLDGDLLVPVLYTEQNKTKHNKNKTHKFGYTSLSGVVLNSHSECLKTVGRAVHQMLLRFSNKVDRIARDM
jgi:hypothetical protein